MIKNIGDKVSLQDGLEMPGFGFGCYLANGGALVSAILEAIKVGYRYIDTAAYYHNETLVGEALAQSPVPRSELFVLSKIWPADFPHPVDALDQSLKKLGLEYLDGYILHWPGLDATARLKAYEALIKEREKGKIRVLGVSNFLVEHLENLHERIDQWPDINQIQIHPFYPQKELCEYCVSVGVQPIGWSPLGRGMEMGLPLLQRMGEALGKSPAQILLRWQIQKNLIPIPKSIHPDRVRENAEVFNFSLDESQMAELDSIALPGDAARLGGNPLDYPPV